MPSIAIDPLPFAVALWARTAEIGVMTIFIAIALTASLMLEELANMADAIKENLSSTITGPNCCSLEFEKWRHQFELISKFVENVNNFFGPILLIKTAAAFGISIFDFNKILQSKGLYPIFYFEFIHTILRFFVILLPSSLVTQMVSH